MIYNRTRKFLPAGYRRLDARRQEDDRRRWRQLAALTTFLATLDNQGEASGYDGFLPVQDQWRR